MARLDVTLSDQKKLSFDLSSGKPLLIGRGEDADVRVEGDLHVSRRHAEVSLGTGKLKVRRLLGASNPVYQGGTPKDEFELPPGGVFVIGRTRFCYVDDAPARSPIELQHPPDAQAASPFAFKTMSVNDLYSMGAQSPIRWNELLELPAILRQRDSGRFHAHIAQLLRRSTRSSWACVLGENDELLGEDSAPGDAFPRYRPSRSLVRKALEEAPQPTLYSWTQPTQQPAGQQATAYAGLDWAVCAAARIPGQPALVLYAAGRDAGGASSRREEARFVGLVADMVARTLAVDRLMTWEGRLERFFAGPIVSKILKSADMNGLEPKLAQSTILFFDIRGYSKRTEEKTEDILPYIGELRRAMTAMTQIIQDEHGVVLQYMGDGIMACWNVPFEETDHVDRACRAALAMADAIGGATSGWRCGIGVHTGQVVAGTMGSEQVFSYGVLGPIVNQASRVEGITKALKTPILVTGEVATRLSPAAGAAVRVGKYQPAGMASALDLYELAAKPSPERARTLEEGLAAFERGAFEAAERAFASLGDSDGPAKFLRERAKELRGGPTPVPWTGVIALSQK